jgi:hypothetical protein
MGGGYNLTISFPLYLKIYCSFILQAADIGKTDKLAGAFCLSISVVYTAGKVLRILFALASHPFPIPSP